MSTEARKVFNIQDQEAKDILEAIKTISPVIQLISEWGKAEREFLEVNDKVEKISSELNALRITLDIISDRNLRDVIEREILNKSKENKIFSKRKEELKTMCINMENEVADYQKYVDNFRRMGLSACIIDKVASSTYFEDEKNILSLIFFIYNTDKIYKNNISDITSKLGWKYTATSTNWNDVLKLLKEL